jgi:hypothetical protein
MSEVGSPVEWVGVTDLLEPPDNLDDLLDMIQIRERLDACIALGAARLDDAEAFAVVGSVSMRSYLRYHARMAHDDAGMMLRTGHLLDRVPELAAAALDRRLSAGQITAIRQVANRDTIDVFADHAAELLPTFEPLTVADTRLACAEWKRRADAIIDKPPRDDKDRDLTFRDASDGATLGRFTLQGRPAEDLKKAITTATRNDDDGETRTSGQRRADALADIVAFFNANHDKPGTPRHRPHVEVLMRGDQIGVSDPFATTSDGTPLPAADVMTLLCDSVIHRVMLAEAAVLDYGRATYSTPLDLFRAIACRDRGCRFPGCDRPVRWTEAHHIEHWPHGGRTEYGNLVLLCSHHHHLIHKPGHDIKLLPDATVIVTMPSGMTMTSRPPP